MLTNVQNIFVMFVTQCLVTAFMATNSFAAPHETLQLPSGLFNKFQDHSKHISQNFKSLSKNKISKNNHSGHGKYSNSHKLDRQGSRWNNNSEESSIEHRGKDHKQNRSRQQHHRKNSNLRKHNNHSQETHNSHHMNQQEQNGSHNSRRNAEKKNTIHHLEAEAHISQPEKKLQHKNSHRHNSKPPIRVNRHTHNQPRHKPQKRIYRRSTWYNTRYLAPINYYYHPIGHRVRYLPEFHVSLIIAGVSYFYYEGIFYRSFGNNYIVVSAPISALVQTLPAGFIAFPIGNRIYYYVNDTYYVWHETLQGYFVIEKPDGADRAISKAIQGRLYAYPKKNLSEEQQAKDRYECHRWGSIELGVDPTLEDKELSAEEKAVYLTAMGACLEGRGYTIK